MEYLRYTAEIDMLRNRFMVNIDKTSFLNVDGIPHHIDKMGKATKPVDDYVLEIDFYINLEAQKTIFYCNPKQPKVLIVLCEHRHLERIYTIGKYSYISTDGEEQGIPSKIRSFEQVI